MSTLACSQTIFISLRQYNSGRNYTIRYSAIRALPWPVKASQDKMPSEFYLLSSARSSEQHFADNLVNGAHPIMPRSLIASSLNQLITWLAPTA
jgi:hypothetical protein